MEDKGTHGTLVLSGEGQVQIKADLATIHLGVITTGKTAQEAAAANAERMNRVLGRLKALGIPEPDLQTVGFSISPIVDYNDRTPTVPQITGYQVENTVSVKVDVERTGRVLDEGVGAGANTGGNLSFGVRDEGPHRRRALEAAVRAARRDADVVAHALGVHIKGTRSAEVVYGGTPILLRSAVRREAATPIEPGVLSISASVRVTYTY